MMTATGLPSTPARNAKRHPHASRPFTSRGSLTASPCRSNRLEQRFNLLLEPRLLVDPLDLNPHDTVRTDQPRHRNEVSRMIRLQEVRRIAAEQNRIRDGVLGGEFPDVIGR